MAINFERTKVCLKSVLLKHAQKWQKYWYGGVLFQK